MLFAERRATMVMFASAKRKLMAKLAYELTSRNATRVALVDTLLERYFPEVLAVVLRNHGRETLKALLATRSNEALGALLATHPSEALETLLATHSSEALEALAKTHFSEMIAAMCRDRIQEVIAQVIETKGGTFRYVGDGSIKIIVGAASQRLPGWLATDIDTLNITQESSWSSLFRPGTIDNILAEHVLEHLSLNELHRVLAYAKKFLKTDGVFRVAVPDAFHPSRYYYNLVKPGGWETPTQHKLFFDHEMLTRVAEQAGYRVRLLEYFDESGMFHKVDYSPNDGSIQRCAANNCGLDTTNEEVMERFYATIPDGLRQQFRDQKITYTSLIADLIS
jgi:predicted SAM-dependent methyltransferase